MDNYMNWPFVGLILGLAALVLFKTELRELIKRTSKVGKDGASFDHPQIEVNKQQEALAFSELMKHPVSASVLDRERELRIELEKQKLPPQQITELLIRGLAISRTAIEFNAVSNTIFGSQVDLLVQISGSSNGVTRQQAEAIFQEAQKKYPNLHGGHKLDEWLHYLQASKLITLTGEVLDITQTGKDFLKHLIDMRLAHPRFG